MTRFGLLLLTIILLLSGCGSKCVDQPTGFQKLAGDEALCGTLAHRLLARRSGGDPAPHEVEILVAQLPEDLGAEIPMPDHARVIGSLVRGQEGTEIVLDAPQTPAQVLAFYEQAMTANGWIAFAYPVEGGFVPGMGRTGLTFCSQTDNSVLWVGAFEGEDAPTDVRLDLRQTGMAACAPDTAAPKHPIPLLEAPPAAQQTSAGFGGSASSFRAEVELCTDLDPNSVELHYGTQLRTAGWQRNDGGESGPLAWSTWHHRDSDGLMWQGLLLVVDLIEDQDKLAVYIQVDLVA